MIEITRTRDEAGQIRYITSEVASEINAGTIIRPFGGERFDVERTEVTAWGETRFFNFLGEVLRIGSENRVEILGHFNI